MTSETRTPVCVLGAGLIGGSLLRAAVSAGYPAWGYNRSGTAAQAEGFDVSADLPAVLRRAAEADALIVVAMPMPAVDHLLEDIATFAPHCALTDVVSVKGPVAELVRKHGLAARYVGGHPMAGTNESGWAAGNSALFHNATWAVGVDAGTHPRPWRRVVRLALDCGSVVVPVLAAEHDRAVARISHLPHVLAEALAAVGAAGGELALGLAAGSFRDGTRVAATAPDLVRAICEPNAAALLEVLEEALTLLGAARDDLRARGSLGLLVDAGHDGRTDYETVERWEITNIRPGDHNWLEQLHDAGRRGGVITRID
ncbi:prephenate dehydrogenase [Nocardia panacis]|uniref:prephenate dehydrogenase n=1 Tax=Nocardia panacis TaxID=2340916 RepID=UPI001EF150C6|nr:prephenate dehydrogenase [Nocardia panacis]